MYILLSKNLNRRNNIFFTLSSPSAGTYVIALHYKGRDKPVLEVDLKLDDLLERQRENDHTLNLEFVKLNVNKLYFLINKTIR